ncbi:helix-turn-helix transcriptional regulator [Streptomyces sp. NPDC059398]|uniref:helix-turn-helix transcriptional regulator n=1 Tax=Streptomyces sp. NPDC059398 TaxID=3346820 RepID=UPI0036B13B24
MTDTVPGALGDFLRSRRERLSPGAVGLAGGRRRRTPGLRREEVAELAEIGVDWYVRLEQGRAVSPSAGTVDALARALRLDPAEHAHLRALAARSGRSGFVRETVPDGIRRLVTSLGQPAYVTGRRWDLLAWNAAAADTLTDFGLLPDADRNVLVQLLTDPAARRLFGAGWADEARRVVGQFRAAHDLWAGDPAFRGLAERLRRESPEFAGWWEGHHIRTGGEAGQKVLHHPRRGLLRFEYASFQATDDPALRLTVYTPV